VIFFLVAFDSRQIDPRVSKKADIRSSYMRSLLMSSMLASPSCKNMYVLRLYDQKIEEIRRVLKNIVDLAFRSGFVHYF
jgi:hypothetical protein